MEEGPFPRAERIQDQPAAGRICRYFNSQPDRNPGDPLRSGRGNHSPDPYRLSDRRRTWLLSYWADKSATTTDWGPHQRARPRRGNRHRQWTHHLTRRRRQRRDPHQNRRRTQRHHRHRLPLQQSASPSHRRLEPALRIGPDKRHCWNVIVNRRERAAGASLRRRSRHRRGCRQQHGVDDLRAHSSSSRSRTDIPPTRAVVGRGTSTVPTTSFTTAPG